MKKYMKYIWILLISFQIQAEDFKIGYIEEGTHSFVQKENENINYEIIYFFSYGCPYCYNLENYVEILKKNIGEDVSFIYKPIVPNEAWREYGRAFYVAKFLNIDIRKKIYEKIHYKNEKIYTKKALNEFFVNELKIDNSDFVSTYNSYMVDYNLKKNELLADQFNVEGTPTLIIIDKNGKTYKTSPKIAGGMFEAISTAVLLVHQ